MSNIKVLFDNSKKEDAKLYGCMECQSSCQSACKTSCTIGNQNCLKKEQDKAEFADAARDTIR